MSYWARFGNTEVRVERRPDNDGVCDHCGKKGIKYLAHVRQQLADTLNRVYSGTLARDDDQVAELGAHLIDGNKVKKVSVGCVCVSKYLVDCGVDTGLAQRLQKGVNTITNLLKNITKVEGFSTPTSIQTVIEEWGSVSVARQKSNEASDAFPYRFEFQFPVTCSPEEKDRGLLWAQIARDWRTDLYHKHRDILKKFRAKYFGLMTRYALDEAKVSDHFDRVLKRFQRTLDIYMKIGEYE